MILIVASHANGRLSKATFELVSAARNLHSELPISILLLGENINACAGEAASIAEQVLVVDHPDFGKYNPETWSHAISWVASEGGARLVLIAGSRSGREYSPRVAVRLKGALLEDVISLSLESAAMQAQRYSYLARVTETLSTEAPVVVATVKPNVFTPAEPLPSPGEQFEVEVEAVKSRVATQDVQREQSSRISLSEADIVVAGGRGVGSAEGFERFVVPLAEALGAAVGATRAVVDAGWRPYTEQVGQTGKSVQPKVYIALGISGATQHLSGMNKSKLVIAINKDADAPIFNIADYGFIGDIEKLMPAVLDKMKRARET